MKHSIYLLPFNRFFFQTLTFIQIVKMTELTPEQLYEEGNELIMNDQFDLALKVNFVFTFKLETKNRSFKIFRFHLNLN